MKRKPDYEGEILKLGWNTESTSSGRMMAERGGMKTGWHDSWQKGLAEISGDVESAKLANVKLTDAGGLEHPN